MNSQYDFLLCSFTHFPIMTLSSQGAYFKTIHADFEKVTNKSVAPNGFTRGTTKISR